MTSLEVKTTLRQFCLLQPGCQEGNNFFFLGWGYDCVLELCFYPRILLLDHFLPCFSDIPPMLLVNSTPVNLSTVESPEILVQQSACEEETQISFLLVG